MEAKCFESGGNQNRHITLKFYLLLNKIKRINLKDLIQKRVITPTDKIGANIPFISEIFLFLYHLIRNL